MKLTDLNPNWVGAGGPGITTRDGQPVPQQHGVGISFDCPCGKCDVRCHVYFENPLGGSATLDSTVLWKRDGSTFETMTLNPSIHRVKPPGCGWHGWVKQGQVTSC